jgi:carbon storage regulator
MLVLSRKAGESLRIGDDIQLVVVRIHKDRVRIGIEAPRDVRIARGELQQLPEPQEDTCEFTPLPKQQA